MTTFREALTFAVKDVHKWFPRHMASGMRKMQQKLRVVDCIIEVRDARIPISGKNKNFERLLTAVRPRILLINKMDLVSDKERAAMEETLRERENCHVFFTNCKDDTSAGLKKVLPTALNLMSSSSQYHDAEDADQHMMVIGIPNVGKSSVINQLRGIHVNKGKATKTGATPGVTLRVLEKIKIKENPKVFLFDTPGVLSPQVNDIETGLKLALCATLKDHLVGEEIIADFLLYWLNKHGDFRYVDCLNLRSKTDNIREVLLQIAIDNKLAMRIRESSGGIKVRPNMTAAATYMIKMFRLGNLGKFNLDRDIM